MKIGKIMAKNFAKVDTISVNIDPTRTYLVGSNKAGKTTVGYSVPFFVMKGLSQRGDGLIAERFRFIGPHGKSAEGEIEIIDEKESVTHIATRKLLKGSTDLKIVSSDGIVRGQEFLDDLFSAILFNVMKFSELTGKEQALAFGVDTSEFDADRKQLEQGRLAIYQDLNRLRGVAETSMGTEKVEEVKTATLLEELEKRQEINRGNAEKRLNATDYQHVVASQKERVVEIETEIDRLKIVFLEEKEKLTACHNTLAELTKVVKGLKSADEQEVRDKIKTADETNVKAQAYKDSLEDQKKADAEQAKYDTKNTEIAAVDTERTVHIKASKLPYNNTTINEDGLFELNGKLFNSTYFSRGECMKFGANLASKIMEAQPDRNELLEYVYVPHAESLDQENREELFKTLADLGLQVVAEYVDTKKIKGKDCILLKELRVIDAASYEDEKSGEELG